MDAGQLSNVLNQMMWGYNTDKSAMASALTFKYKSCNAALTYPSTLGKYFPFTTFSLPDRPDYPDCLLIHITRD
jgi:hypothetical protein